MQPCFDRHSMRRLSDSQQRNDPFTVPSRMRADGPVEPEREALSLEERVDLVAERHGVSGRAREVMLLIAQGRSATRIEQELYISRGTVNTYSHRLYQKLGIHSKQELIDLIYGAEERERGTGRE